MTIHHVHTLDSRTLSDLWLLAIVFLAGVGTTLLATLPRRK